MSTLLATLCAPCVETLLGWAACVLAAAALDREQRAFLRALRGPATLALVVAPVATGLGWLAGSDPRWLLEPVHAIVPGAFTFLRSSTLNSSCHAVKRSDIADDGPNLILGEGCT